MGSEVHIFLTCGLLCSLVFLSLLLQFSFPLPGGPPCPHNRGVTCLTVPSDCASTQFCVSQNLIPESLPPLSPHSCPLAFLILPAQLELSESDSRSSTVPSQSSPPEVQELGFQRSALPHVSRVTMENVDNDSEHVSASVSRTTTI